jgi:hypothetical protein
MNHRIISADDHIDLPWLPKDLWQKRVPEQWRERSPEVVDTSQLHGRDARRAAPHPVRQCARAVRAVNEPKEDERG